MGETELFRSAFGLPNVAKAKGRTSTTTRISGIGVVENGGAASLSTFARNAATTYRNIGGYTSAVGLWPTALRAATNVAGRVGDEVSATS